MGSVIYRDRDRDFDARTTISSARRDGGGGHTTVKRYIIKDDDTRSSHGGRDSRSFVPERSGERVEETRIIRRENDVEELPRREPRREEPRYATEELVIRRDREDDRRDDRRDPYYDRRQPERSSDQELIIRRTTESDDTRREDLAMSRFDDRRDHRFGDGYEVLGPRRGEFYDRDRDVQRYTRTTDYYSPAPQPQPQIVVLKQDPIIIRERIRDDDYQVVRRTDIEAEKSVVRRAPEPPKEEEYFYEKKVRERIDDGRRRSRSRDDDWRDRRAMKREVSPHDSVSQVGGRRDYSSDDSMVYVKRTRETTDERGGSPSPDRRKNMAAGAIAGIGAAELLRNHKKKEGRETSHGIGRLGRDVGAGALGVVAAQGISRARSAYRSRSRRRRSSSSSDDSRSRRRSRSRRSSRSRSRSQSRSKLKTLGAVGLGAAALAAAAAVAAKKMKKKDTSVSPSRGRSSSRHRSDRVESMQELTNDPSAGDDARNPKHRNKRMAEAGAAGAAITALIDRARSKSRGRDQSRSRVRQAAPVVAAGLGSAALAGLYERNKAKKEAEQIQGRERRSARSRSRSRARTEYTDGYRDGPLNDPGLIEYGDGPMHGNNYGEGYYGRPAPQEGYYAQQTAVVPAPGVAPAAYGASRDIRGASPSFSRERRSRSRSHSSSPNGGRSGRRRAADGLAGAGAGAAAASVYERSKQEKRERKARRRRRYNQAIGET